jgi:hypothetical protein
LSGTEVVVLVHALLGVLFLSALIGRWVVLGLAERATDVRTMRTLATAASPFERMVRTVPGLVLVFGLVAAFLEGRNVLGPLTGGSVDWLFVSVILYFSPLPLIPLVFLPRGRVFEAALAEAEAEGHVTPAVQAAWRDPVTRVSHVYELAAITLVLILMLSKPF